MFEQVIGTLPIVFSLKSILIIFFGVSTGIMIGAMPGLTATMGVALLIPVTFGMDAASGLILLGSIYCGAIYGGSISAILLQVPGTPSSIATSYDGFPMTKKGEGDRALKVAITSSFCGGIISTFLLLLFAPPLASFALMFGAAEYFWVAMVGLAVIISLSASSIIKGFISACIGLLVGTIGIDMVTGVSRFTFGNPQLLDGVSVIVLLIGLYSIPQALVMIEDKFVNTVPKIIQRGKVSNFAEVIGDVKNYYTTYIRSSILGTIIGLIPGAGGDIASFMGYEQAKRTSKNPEKFGTGTPEGVAGSEAANNGVVGGSLIPLLTLGIPGNAVSAVLLGGLIIHGMQPGPTLFVKHGPIVYTFIVSLFLANIIMLILGYYGSYVFSKVTKVPNSIVAPLVIVLSIIGSYAIRNSIFDSGMMLFFGFVGYLMRKAGIEAGPAVLGLILGPIAEINMRRALRMSQGNIAILFEGKIVWVLIVLFVIMLTVGIISFFKKSGISPEAE
jgi:putative tricarboxylic transport membrane protein